MVAKYNPLNRPRDETVQLTREERRFEPFWHIQAKRAVDYTCQVTYQVPVPNPHAQSVDFEGRTFDVARQKDKARVELIAIEHCYRTMAFDRLIDGLARDIKPADLELYIRKYKFTEREQLDLPELVKPLVPLVAAKQRATASLSGEAVQAHEIQSDRIDFERTYMYARPVFAFEFRWAGADRMGVIEVDGLTGEVIEGGNWFKDKVNRVVTRDTLIELGAEVAGAFVPGGGVAVKLVGKMIDPNA